MSLICNASSSKLISASFLDRCARFVICQQVSSISLFPVRPSQTMPSRGRGRTSDQRNPPKMVIKKEHGAVPTRHAKASDKPPRMPARNVTPASSRRLENVGASSSKELEQSSAGTVELGQESGGGEMTFDLAGRVVAKVVPAEATASDESRCEIPKGTNGASTGEEAGLPGNGVDTGGRGNRRESSVHVSPLRMSNFIRRANNSQGGVINSSQPSLMSPTSSRQRSSQMQAAADAATQEALAEMLRDAFGTPTRHSDEEDDEMVKNKKKKKDMKEKTRNVQPQKQKERDVWAESRGLSLTPSPSEDARLSDAEAMNQLEEEVLEEEAAVEVDENVSADGAGRGAPVAPSSPAGNSSSSRVPFLFNEEDSNLKVNSPFEDDEREADEDLDEEEEMYEDEEEEEEHMDAAARSQTAAFKKVITVRGAAIRKDRGDATDAQVRAVEKVIDDAMASNCVLCEVPIDKVRIEDDSEIDKDTVRKIVEKIKKGKLLMECATMIGWRDGVHVYLIDGRHCFTAYKAVVEEAISVRKADLSKRQYTVADYKVKVQVMSGGKLAAHVKKLANSQCNTPTPFEKVRFIRFVMYETGMLGNPAIKMLRRMTLLNQKICGRQKRSKEGIPYYTVQAACFNEAETKFMASNIRMVADSTSVLKLYCTARSVNSGRAFEILQELDGEMDKRAAKPSIDELRDMKNNVSQLLQRQGYSPDDANAVQLRLYKNKESFQAIRRLMSGRNRLSRLQDSPEQVLEALERCWPPVTFASHKLAYVQCLTKAPSTLFIIDCEAFYDTSTLNIPKACAELINVRESRVLNFIIVEGESEKVEAKMKKAIEELRMQRSRNNAEPLELSEVEVGTAQVSVSCAPFERTVAGIPRTFANLGAVLMRASSGAILDEAALHSFMNNMKIHGAIGRTCLHLLSYDPDLEARHSTNNSVFVCSRAAVGPIAVAAHCSANRITSLHSLSTYLSDKLRRMQAKENDEWTQYPAYKHLFTPDGKVRDAAGTRRKRKSQGNTAT